MGRRILASAIGLAACGRVGFEELAPGPGSVGALACGDSLAVAALPEVPLGLDLVATSGGAIAAWSRGAPAAELAGTRLALAGDEVVSAEPWSTELPQAIGAFGLAADGDARFLLAAQLAGGALFAPLDGKLATVGAWTIEDGLALTSRAVAEPLAPAGPFVAAALEGGEVAISRLDAAGASTGTVHRRPAGRDAAIRRAAKRHFLVWAAPVSGCAVWAFDERFDPVLPDPLVHAPAGACQQPAITRHDAGVNLIAWLDGGDAHAQLGTDTDYVGAELSIGADADRVDLAVAPSGFFLAVASGGAAFASHVRVDATGLRTLASVPHLRGAPVRLISHGDGALLATIEEPASRPKLWLTRLCE